MQHLIYYIKQSHGDLSQNGYPDTIKNTDKEILGTCITINATKSCVDLPDCMTAGEIRVAAMKDEHLSEVAELVLCSWPSTNTVVQKELQLYCLFSDEKQS